MFFTLVRLACFRLGRRVGAALRQQGITANHKKILPNLASEIIPTGPTQLWVADITYVALPTRFIYVAVILDAWSRLIVGYAIGRSIDARLTLAALRTAFERRRPPTGCIHHSDRGSQYAAGIYRDALSNTCALGENHHSPRSGLSSRTRRRASRRWRRL